MQIGDTKAVRQHKVKGVLHASPTYRHPVEIPFGIATGAAGGPVAAVTAGIHGQEYAGMEAASRLFRQLQPGEMKGTVIVVPVVNMPAFLAGMPFVTPQDGLNLNRVFPGDGGSSISYRIARTLFNEIGVKCDYLLDLHGADGGEDQFPNVIAKLAGDGRDQESEAVARAFGLEYIRRSVDGAGSTPGTFVGVARKRGTIGLTTEIGGEGRYDETEINLQLNGVLNVLRYLNVVPGTPEPLESFAEQKVIAWPEGGERVVTETGGIFHPYVKPRQLVRAGELVAEIKDEWGDVKERHAAPTEVVVRLIRSKRIMDPGDLLFSLIRAV
ncbi:MAG: succinylglutamate desuccinylase/aspartoacylase family protein [Thermaerobacterales bacterium]